MNGWQVGDLALCVDAAPCRCCAAALPVTEGKIYEVLEVYLGRNLRGVEGAYLVLAGVGLSIPTHPIAKGLSANRFRKVLRDKHEACESEFVTLLKRSTKKVSA